MAAQRLLVGSWHGYLPALRHRLALEALVNGHTEDEGIARGKAGAHQGKAVSHPLVRKRFVLRRILVTPRRWLYRELRDVIGPFAFGAGSLRCYGFDAVTNLRTAVRSGSPFPRALIIVNEQARGHDDRVQTLFHLIKFERGGNRVGGAASQLPLIIDRRAVWTQIKAARQCHAGRVRGGVQVVALVR